MSVSFRGRKKKSESGTALETTVGEEEGVPGDGGESIQEEAQPTEEECGAAPPTPLEESTGQEETEIEETPTKTVSKKGKKEKKGKSKAPSKSNPK